MKANEFVYGAPHGLLVLKFVKENEGCTVAQIKQYLGIPLQLPPIISPVGPANRVSMEIASGFIRRLALNRFIKIEQTDKFVRLWGLRIKDSSNMYITPQGEEFLDAHVRRIMQVLEYIRENAPCLNDVHVYWKRLCSKSKARFLDEQVDILSLMGRLTFVELIDGKNETIVRLTEKGATALKSNPEEALQLIYRLY